MSLPGGIGTYQVIRTNDLTPEQRDILRRAGQERVVERLTALMTKMVIPASGAQRFYAAYVTAMESTEGGN